MRTTFFSDAAVTDDLVRLIAERAPAADASGAMDPEVVAGLRATGINRLMVPVELGGLAASPRRAVEAVERIGAADGSAAWTAAIGLGTNLFAGYLHPDAAADVFADPDQSNAAMFAPTGRIHGGTDGTWHLSGRWPFASNCEQAAWIGLGALFPDEPAPRLVFAPRHAMTILPTWDVTGLRATASNDVTLTDFAVDRRYTCSFAERPWAEGPLWCLPVFVALAPPLAAVAVGIARGALDEISRQALAGREQMRGRLLDDAIGTGDLADADTRLRSARAGLFESVDECWSQAEAGTVIDRVLQARSFLASQHCVDVAVEVAATCHRLGGGAAAYRSSPLLRAVRDLETARQHAMFNRGLRSRLGRIIGGTDEPLPPFVI